jgi:hypothetical protein
MGKGVVELGYGESWSRTFAGMKKLVGL